MRFSEKEGHKILDPLSNNVATNLEFNLDIWNMSYGLIFSIYRHPPQSDLPTMITGLKSFFIFFYAEVLKKSIDQIPNDINKAIKKTKKYMLQAKTNEIFDSLEILSNHFPDIRNSYQDFEYEINKILEKYSSIYRLINKKFTRITSQQEIQSIEEALENTNPYPGVQQHLKQALQLTSDRQNPNYAKSMQESISAVEGLAMKLLNHDSITLGKAIPQLKNKYGLHQHLLASLDKLYAYTCDEDGVRHGSPNESTVTYSEAKFTLIACTNFINYLIDKTKDQS